MPLVDAGRFLTGPDMGTAEEEARSPPIVFSDRSGQRLFWFPTPWDACVLCRTRRRLMG